jgi:putative protease
MIKPELILPAGNLEKAEYALAYGADAVYAGLPGLSLRTRYTSFDENTLSAAVDETHRQGKRFYVAVNLYPHEHDLATVGRFLESLADSRPDALIISDPGVLRIIRRLRLDTPLHLSTQANTTNSESILFWRDEGISRVILARELSFTELARICECAAGIELELFVHGAMCISYSGRCLLSAYLAGRDANRGECAASCRWRYALVEESREDQSFEIEEDRRGSYILNSRDLCLLDRLAELRELSVHGYKIEGRTKNLFYVSLVARAYRKAIDDVFDRGLAVTDSEARHLVDLTDSHGFTTGFLFPPEEPLSMQNHRTGALRKQHVVGLVTDFEAGRLRISVKNPLAVGDLVLGISPREVRPVKVLRMTGEEGDLKRAFGSRGQEVWADVDTELTGDAWRFGILVKE